MNGRSVRVKRVTRFQKKLCDGVYPRLISNATLFIAEQSVEASLQVNMSSAAPANTVSIQQEPELLEPGNFNHFHSVIVLL